ncbi:DUF4142 domain-containing protein [Pedobacter namyangjuensis]|uniref:DUF4142 domain-containing protein n=1 Tax=Pedobacter namyangjuensis TaxID=600626 RepID=UPI000DE3879F|nr:DUF4142 domain-containing protein [Pedobacter namyangjuensis]
MKKLGIISMIAVAAFTFQSCSNETKDSKEVADSLNEAKDTTSNSTTTGGIAVNEDDASFATKAAMGGMAEVEFSKVAVQKATNVELKSFADMMVSDHGKVNEDLKTLAGVKNITLPGMLDDEHQKMLTDLSAKSGSDFDKKYASMMVDDHQKTYDLLDKQAKDGTDSDLKAFAAKTAPIVKGHLDKIKSIKDKLK